MSEQNLDTFVVHAASRRKAIEEAPTVNPVYFSTTYTLDNPSDMDEILGGNRAGFTYARHGNPTLSELETTICTMEHGETAKIYASGMAALQGAVLACDVTPGSTIIASRDLYGATITLLKEVFGHFGIQVITLDMTKTDQVEVWLKKPEVQAMVFESISNPLLRVVDLPVLLKLAKQYNVKTIVDNTFATPYLCKPLDLGATMVVHSLTKYLNGHGDAMGGAVVTTLEYRQKLTSQLKLTGGVMGPMEAWLTQRGLKTFVLRFERQLASAHELATRLSGHPAVQRVYHPSLQTHPDFQRATALFPNGQGAVLSFEVDGGREAVFQLMRNLNLVVPATTVGDVYSLLLYPVMASHRSLTPEERQASGITDGLVRLAVGIEHVEDIWDDLKQALSR